MIEMDRALCSINVNIGILGHVDSGKTSLVRALSTSLSTAALDKHPQSQQRGITLDLGFSAFSLPVPVHLREDLDPSITKVQFTLVDCPGHASLIKTIIGGAQIIDMVILVIDANKGIQAQTAECIVLGEITTDKLFIVLNKIDSLHPDDRQSRVDQVSKEIHEVFASTKFKGAPIIPTAACVGGEKAATSDVTSGSLGVDTLVSCIRDTVKLPHRNVSAPFYFSIDHCFPIKGHGTVLTGTVLSGSVSTNSIIELPYIQQQRKVKSMQMFRKSVKTAVQGDRVGICVTNLDSTSIERGIAAAPGSVPLLSSVICMVKKVRYFQNGCKSNTKYHISIGHTTVLATAMFYGAKELSERAKEGAGHNVCDLKSDESNSSTLSTTFQGAFPHASYDWGAHHEVQSELVGDGEYINRDEDKEDANKFGAIHSSMDYGDEPVQWALLQFQQAVYCPIGSLIIGSRLDINSSSTNSGSVPKEIYREELRDTKNSSKSCRLAFYGPAVEDFSKGKMEQIKLFHWKHKEAEVLKLTDLRRGTVSMCYELIANKLFSEGGSITPFIGMRLLTASNHVGIITGSYGAGGQFKVKFSSGVPRGHVIVGSKLTLRFKRFVFDRSKIMCQFDQDFDNIIPVKSAEDPFGYESEEDSKSFPPNAGSAKRRSSFTLSAPAKELQSQERRGVVEVLKEGGLIAIVSGAFTIEEDIRSLAGAHVHAETGADGVLMGPFAKLGKCKVKFVDGSVVTIGSTVTITILK